MRFHRNISLFLLIGIAPPVAAAAGVDGLDKPLAHYKETTQKRGLLYFCMNIADLPCGWETILIDTQGQGKESPLLEMNDTTPRKVLDEIVRRLPNSRWVVRDGAINVEPRRRNRDDLLGRRLSKFSEHGVSSFRAAMDMFEDAGISISYEEMGHTRRFGSIDVDLQDVTVRDALNAIVKADGKLMWLFSVNPDPKHTGTLSFLSDRKSGGTTSAEDLKKTKRWKRENSKSSGSGNQN